MLTWREIHAVKIVLCGWHAYKAIQDVDFTVDIYNAHKTSMLLNTKHHVDNTFDYEGGIGQVTEEASMQH